MRRVLVAVVVAVVAVAGCGGVDRAAPGYTATDLRSGDRVDLASLRGRPAVLSAWTTWCHNCDEDLALLGAFSRSPASRPFEVVAVNLDVASVEDEIDAKIEAHDLEVTLWRDRTNRFRSAFGAVGVPTTVVLDARGTVVRLLPGAVDFTDPEVVAALAAARAGRS
jgi:thiol-disulfide isomerase/thioredoxin